MAQGWAQIVVFLVVLLLPTLVLAQAGTGQIQGVCRDPEKAAVPGATVTIRDLETGMERVLKTDEAGRFAAPFMPAGTYSVVVTNVAGSLVSASAILTVVQPDTVIFCDVNLEDAVRSQLGKATGAVNRLEIRTLTFLRAVDSHVTCLGGLEWATNLASLQLDSFRAAKLESRSSSVSRSTIDVRQLLGRPLAVAMLTKIASTSTPLIGVGVGVAGGV